MSTTADIVQPSFPTRVTRGLSRRLQRILDTSVTYPALRWIFLVLLVGAYAFRVYTIQGFYIISYGLGIYILNLLIGFLSPRDELEAAQDGPTLPSKDSDEFKPFQRRLPEFGFWKSAARAVFISLCCTLFKFLDVPVFWPILLLYFIILFVLTMKRQIGHMIKFKYLPFSWGKKTYSGADKVTKKAEPAPLPRMRKMIRKLPSTVKKVVKPNRD